MLKVLGNNAGIMCTYSMMQHSPRIVCLHVAGGVLPMPCV